MGLGKSTAAQAAAEIVRCSHFDTDDWLERVHGVDIPKLVEQDEAEFRKIELEALHEILGKHAAIVSTGGGIVKTEDGRAALSQIIQPVVWLRGSFDLAASRVKQDTGRRRPFFDDIDLAQQLFDQRQPWYEQTANFTINANQPKKTIAKDIAAIATRSF